MFRAIKRAREATGRSFTPYSPVTFYVDMLFCIIILLLIFLIVPIGKWLETQPLFALALIIYLYSVYFTYRRIHIPSLFLKKKYGRIILYVMLLVLVTELLTHFPLAEHPDARLPMDFRRHMHTQTIWFFFLIISGFSLAIEVTFELFRQIIQKQEVEAAKNRAELAIYRTQINPHFLFNTLNTLYGLILTKSEQAESAFVKFSNILKYMYDKASEEKISLRDEVEYIRQYVDLQKLRLNHHTQVVFESHLEETDVPIPPMLLITFVENAFKYGTSSSEDCVIRIRINVVDGILLFSTRNAIMKERKEDSSSIGIENCRKRLQLLYPDRFTLVTGRDAENRTFDARLTLQLT